MKTSKKWLIRAFVLVMLLFSAAMAFYTIERASLDFQKADLQLSLETSYGRERKQQHEYDEVTSQLPLTRGELAETAPKAEAASAEVTRLKEERKRLRAEKKELEQKLEEAEAGEEADGGAGT